jgi:hypothetical protein
MIEIIISLSVIVFTVLLVLFAARGRVPQIEGGDTKLPVPSAEWLKTAYDATTSLYIEVDREIWQISTIFLSASLIIMGWVMTSLDKIDTRAVVIAGAASILMVGVATLFKHRLRIFNLVHIEYLRRLEEGFIGQKEAAEYWGVHHVRSKLKAGNNPARWITSIHGVMDVYFILFIAIWLALFMIANTRTCVLLKP